MSSVQRSSLQSAIDGIGLGPYQRRIMALTGCAVR
jgi:hypothetical protein